MPRGTEGVALNEVKEWRQELHSLSGWPGRRVRRVEVWRRLQRYLRSVLVGWNAATTGNWSRRWARRRPMGCNAC